MLRFYLFSSFYLTPKNFFFPKSIHLLLLTCSKTWFYRWWEIKSFFKCRLKDNGSCAICDVTFVHYFQKLKLLLDLFFFTEFLFLYSIWFFFFLVKMSQWFIKMALLFILNTALYLNTKKWILPVTQEIESFWIVAIFTCFLACITNLFCF